MKRNNLFMIIGILIVVAVYIANILPEGNLQKINSVNLGLLCLAVLADALLTPISWIGIVFFVLGINGLKKITLSEKSQVMLTNKEKKVLRYFGVFFLLTLALKALMKTFNILLPIWILCWLVYLFLGYKSISIIKKGSSGFRVGELSCF